MKYKNLKSAAHNFVHSFLSLMNYVDQEYIVDELALLVKKGNRIELDFINRTLSPSQAENQRIRKSIDFYCNTLEDHFLSHQTSLGLVTEFLLEWDQKDGPTCSIVDDRGVRFTQKINQKGF